MLSLVNNKFLLYELDNDENKQKEILALEPEIKKYFICGKWSCFKNDNIKNKSLSIVKSLIKEQGMRIMITENIIESKRTKVYHIVKNI